MKISDEWFKQLLCILYHRRTSTRRELTTATSLNPACVSLTIRHLMKCGVVQVIGGLRSTARRKQDLLKLNSEAGYFVVADLEGTRIRFGLANLLGDIRYRWEEDLRHRPVLTVDDLVTGIQVVLRSLNEADRSRVLAVGVSYTGLMSDSGTVSAVNLGWKDFPLREQLKERIDLPVFYGNDGFCKILAERWLGVAENTDNCLYVMAGVGIGVGCYIDGRFLTGEHKLAGEFGHLTIDPGAPDRCNCGKTGCLEAIVSSPNIVRQYLAKSGRSEENRDLFPVTEVFGRARAGDPSAIQVMERVGHYLGLGLSHLVSILNPALIVLGGDLVAAQDLLIPALRQELERHCLPALVGDLELKASTLGHDGGLRGAASLAFCSAVLDEQLLKRITSPVLLRAHRPAPKKAARRLKVTKSVNS